VHGTGRCSVGQVHEPREFGTRQELPRRVRSTLAQHRHDVLQRHHAEIIVQGPIAKWLAIGGDDAGEGFDAGCQCGYRGADPDHGGEDQLG